MTTSSAHADADTVLRASPAGAHRHLFAIVSCRCQVPLTLCILQAGWWKRDVAVGSVARPCIGMPGSGLWNRRGCPAYASSDGRLQCTKFAPSECWRLSWAASTSVRSSRGSTMQRRRRGTCLLYTSDAADERSSVDLGGR